jgi:hypothetical protein
MATIFLMVGLSPQGSVTFLTAPEDINGHVTMKAMPNSSKMDLGSV